MIRLGIGLATIGIGLMAHYAIAAPDKVLYELQEKCGRSAAAAFSRDNPDGSSSVTADGSAIASFENHYSASLNKCFVLESVTLYTNNSKPARVVLSLTLFDVNENKEYGRFFGSLHGDNTFMCDMQEKTCRSQDEWRQLAREYMEN